MIVIQIWSAESLSLITGMFSWLDTVVAIFVLPWSLDQLYKILWLLDSILEWFCSKTNYFDVTCWSICDRAGPRFSTMHGCLICSSSKRQMAVTIVALLNLEISLIPWEQLTRIWLEFRRPRFESWSDLNVFFFFSPSLDYLFRSMLDAWLYVSLSYKCFHRRHIVTALCAGKKVVSLH